MLYTMPRYFRVCFLSFSFEEKTFFSTVLIYEMYSSDTSYNFNSLIGISYREKGNHGNHPSILKFPTVWQGISWLIKFSTIWQELSWRWFPISDIIILLPNCINRHIISGIKNPQKERLTSHPSEPLQARNPSISSHFLILIQIIPKSYGIIFE